VAISNLANPSTFLPSPAKRARPFSRALQSKSHPEFRVFPTGEAECPWRIVALTSNQTISHHKSLAYALRKCTRLNRQLEQAKPDPLTVALSGFRDVNSYRAYYEGVANDSE